MKLTVFDRTTFSVDSKREYTDEGFLKVPGRVARTGVQEYLACELGITDRKPNDIIKVMRPAEQVFSADSLATYDGADITIEHPGSFVDADNYSQVSAGVVRGAGRQDGDFVLCNLLIKDKDGIAAVESGKVQLSAGYTSEYVKAGDSDPYDFIQTDIKINHVALVDRARAGAQARLFDHHHGAREMTKITLDSDRTVEIEDGATATLVTDSIDRLTKRATDAESKNDAQQATIDAQAEEITALKAKSSDEAIEAQVKAIAVTIDTARKIAGPDFTCDSLVVADIQRAALTKVRDSVEWTEKSVDYVQAAFDMAAEKSDEEEEEEGKTKDSYKQLAQDAAKQPADKQTVSAYDGFKNQLGNAWKGEK